MKELDELDRLTKEIVKAAEADQKTRRTRAVLCVILTAVGLPMFIYHTSWQVGLSLFMLLWANNISIKLDRR